VPSPAQVLVDLESVLLKSESTDPNLSAEMAIRTILLALSSVVWADAMFWTGLLRKRPWSVHLTEPVHPGHPRALVGGWESAGDQSVPIAAVHDVPGRPATHPSWLLRECQPYSSCRDALLLHLTQVTERPHFIVVARASGPAFDDADRLLLRLLRPHLDAGIRRIVVPGPRLAAREIEVLRRVREDCSNAAIARRLGVAESTVMKHLEHIDVRSGVHSRTQAVRLCEPALS
jgi:DNA-binding CsgD family transcriptional regulator